MGVFALALVIGAILHLFWPEKDCPRTQGQRARRWLLWLVAGLVAHTAWTEWTLSPTLLLEAIGRGDAGRFVLGLALGFGTARALEKEFFSGVNFLWLSLTALLIAISAPHMDKWLSKLASFKTSAFEVQLAATANINPKVAVAEGQEAFASSGVFDLLGGYHERIHDDVEFIQAVEIPTHQKLVERGGIVQSYASPTALVEKTRKLHYFYRELVAPLAKCYSDATPSIEQLRVVLRPIAFDIQEIVYRHADLTIDWHERNIKFWRRFSEAAYKVDEFRTKWDIKCGDKADAYYRKHRFIHESDPLPGFPRFAEFAELPYLYNVAAALMAILNESEAGLGILEHAKSKVGERIDYFFLTLAAHFQRSLGYPAASTAKLYNDWRQIAVKRQRQLDEQCRTRCEPAKEAIIRHLQDRHRRAEIIAINFLVYHVSEDLARGVQSAKRWEVAAEQQAAELKKMIDNKEVARLLPGYYHDVLDTYAYARMVIEAQKSRPDTQVFKEMQRELQGVVSHFAERADEKPSKYTYWQLNAAQTHYNSARELSGE
jgi:hypothetical protein